MRAQVREEEPALWDLMTLDGTDALLSRLMADPGYVRELAAGLEERGI